MHVPIPVAVLRRVSAGAGYCEFEPRRGHQSLALVNVVCCQVEVAASDWSLIQRSPTDCDVSYESDREIP